MENPTILNKLYKKLQLSDTYDISLGAGIKTFQINPTPMAEIHTGHVHQTSLPSPVYATGANTGGADTIGLGQLCILTSTTAKLWEVYCSSDGVIVTVTITGVDENNNEIYEDITSNGTTAIPSINKYKMVNNINMKAFGSNQVVYCRPQGGTPQNMVLRIQSGVKNNPFFMCSNKNGRTRKARFRSINYLYMSSCTNIGLHVFNNNVSVDPSGYGIHNVKYTMSANNNVIMGITFPDDGILELSPGELAVFYFTDVPLSGLGYINFTLSYYYTS